MRITFSKVLSMVSPGRLYQIQVSASDNPQAELCDSHTLHLDQCEDGKEIAANVFNDVEPNTVVILETYGKKLFNLLFKQDTLARRLLEAILPPNPVGRVLMDFNHNCELDNIPWEYMRSDDGYLVQRCMFTRTQSRPEPELQILPLRILYVTPDPVNSHLEGLKDLHLSDQVQTFINSSNDREVTFERVFPPTVDKMESLLTHRPDTATVLHFMGHCTKSTVSQRALIFENEAGKANIVDTRRLLSRHENLRLAFLSACNTREVAREMTNYGVPYAIGSFCSLPNDIARRFETKFYQCLVDGSSVEEAMWKTRVAVEYSNYRQRDYLPGAMLLYSCTSQVNHGQFSCKPGKPVVELHLPPNNLDTITITSKSYGRKKEMIDLCDHFLRMTARGGQIGRVYTIAGINGQGKTTLAIKLAYRVAHAFPGGIFAWQFDDCNEAISAADYLWRLSEVMLSDEALAKLRCQYNNGDVKKLGKDICKEFSGKASKLLILDHADTLKRALDRGDEGAVALKNWLLSAIAESAVNILVTSHEPLDWLSRKKTMQLKGFDDEDTESGAQLFIENLTGDACKGIKTKPNADTKKLLCELVRVVHGHPLSLVRLARTASLPEHCCKSLEDIICRDYRTLLAVDNSKWKSLDDCFKAMINDLQPQQRLLLHVCSLFSRAIKSEDIIAASQVIEYNTQCAEKLEAVSITDINNNLQELCVRGLLFNDGNNGYRGHISVCEAAKQLNVMFKSPKYDTIDGVTLLHKIAANGYVDGVKLLVTEFKLDANAKNNNGMTPLHLAAEKGHFEVLKLLITNFGAHANAKSNNGVTPLHMAAKEGHVTVARWLMVESGANVEAKRDNVTTPDHLAKLDNLAENLRTFDTNTNAENNGNQRSFPWSAKKVYVKVVTFFLTAFDSTKKKQLASEAGDDSNNNNDTGPPLTTDDNIESDKGYAETMRLPAIDFSVHVNVEDDDGWTPLHQAAEHGHTEMVRFLAGNLGANKNTKAKDGQTPLHRAAGNGHVEVVKLLVHDFNTDTNTKAKDGQTPLHRAVRNGHVEVVKQLASNSGTDINDKDDDGWTLLHRAAENGHIEIVRLLVIDFKMNGNVKNNNRLTPLHYATENGHVDVVTFLANELGDDVNIKAEDGPTPLHQAMTNGHTNMNIKAEDGSTPLHQAVPNGRADNLVAPDPNSKSNGDRTPIYLAAFGGNVEMMKQLVTDVKAKDCDGWTLLHRAAENGFIEGVRLLLAEFGANPNAKSNDGKTPLHLAADHGHVEIVKLLAGELGANTDTRANDGQTPLHRAACNGYAEIVRILAAKLGEDSNIKDNTESTPAHLAAFGGHLEVVRQLVTQFGTNVNTKDDKGWTLLHWAAAKGHTDLVTLLVVELGADTNARSNDDQTPIHLAASRGYIEVTKQLFSASNTKDNDGCALLHWAAAKGHTDLVRLLLSEIEANPNARSNDGQTPLHLATDCGQVEMVKLLVSNLGANVNSKAKDEQTPLHRAARNGHTEIVRLLMVEFSADVNAKDNKGSTPAHLATLGGHVELINQLCTDMDVNVRDNEGRTLLHLAAEKGYTEVVSLLITKFGADINAKSKDGQTPLHRAVHCEHVDMVKLLCKLGADTDVKYNERLTPSRRAVRHGKPKMVETLGLLATNDKLKGPIATVESATAAEISHITPSMCDPKPTSSLRFPQMATKNIGESTTVSRHSVHKPSSNFPPSNLPPSNLPIGGRRRSSATTGLIHKKTESTIKKTEKSEPVVGESMSTAKRTEKSAPVVGKSVSTIKKTEKFEPVVGRSVSTVKKTEKSKPVVGKSISTVKKFEKFEPAVEKSEKPKSPKLPPTTRWR